MFGSPAAATRVGIQSSCDMTSLMMVLGLMTPGHLTNMGTRNPPLYTVPFSPRKGWLPPSGQLKVSAPLSLVKSTMVLSAMPS